MDTRRRFIQKILQIASATGIFLSPAYAWIRSALAEAGKWILPKGFNLEKLINKNPDTLDTRNLEPIPLDQFGTMGITDYKVDLANWRLVIDGHVKKPSKLKYSQLLELPSIERNVLLICPGVFANFGRWKGVSFKVLLDAAKAEDGVTHVTVRGPEGSYEKVQRFPISDIMNDKVFLAYQVNGKILPMKHGHPLRVVAEGYYGFDWVKFIYKVEVNRIIESSEKS